MRVFIAWLLIAATGLSISAWAFFDVYWWVRPDFSTALGVLRFLAIMFIHFFIAALSLETIVNTDKKES